MNETVGMPPLERAARAVVALQPMDRDEADDIVRAVLQAIREPSEHMKFEGAAMADQGPAFAPIETIEDAWAAMIDAALSE